MGLGLYSIEDIADVTVDVEEKGKINLGRRLVRRLREVGSGSSAGSDARGCMSASGARADAFCLCPRASLVSAPSRSSVRHLKCLQKCAQDIKPVRLTLIYKHTQRKRAGEDAAPGDAPPATTRATRSSARPKKNAENGDTKSAVASAVEPPKAKGRKVKGCVW